MVSLNALLVSNIAATAFAISLLLVAEKAIDFDDAQLCIWPVILGASVPEIN